MTPGNRETLQRVIGMLSGITAGGDVSNAVADMLIAAAEMIEKVLEEKNDYRKQNISNEL